MSIVGTYRKAHNEALRALFKRSFVTDIHDPEQPKLGHALLLYKTDTLVPGHLETYNHTNNWEVGEMVRSLNSFGYWVDVIDRSQAPSLRLQDKYQLFIANASSDSGQHFPYFAEQVPHAHKVFYATTSSPSTHNDRIIARYKYFHERTGQSLAPKRLTKHVDMSRAMQLTDTIFSLGNDYNSATYDAYGKTIRHVRASTAPNLYFDAAEISDKDPRQFLFLAGAGNILKGLDLLLETFAELPHLTLHVACPLEEDFLALYQPLLARSPNIHVHGFMEVTSRQFHVLTSQCGYCVLPSCTEATATSVTTCMRRGLIPVVTPEAGLATGDFGFTIEDIAIQALRKQMDNLAGISRSEFEERLTGTYVASAAYTQSSFTESFTAAVRSSVALGAVTTPNRSPVPRSR